jgi:uncharacterized membrane protein YcaP (DUF421 family)
MRLLGKRQLGEMELSEFVLAAMVADLAALPLQDLGIPMINGIIPIIVLFCCELLIAGACMKNIRLRAAFYGKPSLLIIRGKIVQKEMFRNRFTADELMQELRNQGVLDIATIEYAILETDGTLNVVPFPAQRPVTPLQLGIDAGDEGYPYVVISNGRVLQANLKHLGRDLNWLDKQLKQRKLSSPSQVYLMVSDQSDRIYLAEMEDKNEA